MRKLKKNDWISIGVSIWISFLSAAGATALFFASFDPSIIAQLATYPIVMSRTAGYSIGFLLFWLLLIINSLAVIFLIRGNPK